MQRIYLLLGLAVLISSSLAAQQPARKASGNSRGQSDLKPVYQRWLSEDVAYIITPGLACGGSPPSSHSLA